MAPARSDHEKPVSWNGSPTETQGRWRDFYSRVVAYSCESSGQRLPDDYVAQMDEEVRVVSWQEGHHAPNNVAKSSLIPDSVISRSRLRPKYGHGWQPRLDPDPRQAGGRALGEEEST